MWERDTGFVPVVDHDGVPVGVLTDRDLCMAAYTQGRTLSVVYAEAVMSKPVQVCHSHDTVAEALGRMQAARVRRLPVVDEHEHIVGVIALGDVARLSTGVDESGASGVVEPTGVDELGLRVVGVLAAISEPWLPHPRRTASEPSAHPDEPAQPSPPPPPPS
jgi:CBS-domain-containing membrane protein